MNRNSIPVFVGMFCFFLVFALMPRVGDCAPIEAKISHFYAPGTIWARQLEIMEKYIEKGTGGKVDVKIYPSGMLHSTYEESFQACTAGTVPLSFGNITTPQAYDRRWTCYQVPGVVRGWEHWKRVQETPSFKALNDALAAKTGVRLWFFSCVIPYGDIPWNTKRPLVTPDDWKGLKMRTAPSPLQMKAVKAFGATPVPLGTAETLAAISQGVVDGGIITPSTAVPAWSAKETLPYVTMPYGGFALSFMSVAFFINDAWFKNLPKDIQNEINATIPKLREATEADSRVISEKLWDEYQKAPGRKVTFLTEKQTGVWSDRIKGIADGMGCEQIFKECEAVR
jgi:C4-dicarboxylate-binding protein DctP